MIRGRHLHVTVGSPHILRIPSNAICVPTRETRVGTTGVPD